MNSDLHTKYSSLLSLLKEKIRQARQKASLSVNKELLSIYLEIGNLILKEQSEQGWGSRIIKQLSLDLKAEFPDMKGFSERNLVYMQTFASAYTPLLQFTQASPAQLNMADNLPSITQGAPAQTQKALTIELLASLSWYHHTTILDKVKEQNFRIFYIHKTIENGWSRDIMVHQIESNLHTRQGALTHNFNQTLPAYHSELTQQLFKDPYQLDFIMLSETAKERDLENALMDHITNFLIELGAGFAFMGRQTKFEVGNQEFFIDLLFYHTKLRRHIIIELKIGDFEPEYISKMNLYLGLADDKLKGELDDPSIGLILCKTKNKIVAEYALRDTSKPIGIAEYKIAERLPEDIKGELPTIEEIELKLDEELKANPGTNDKRLEKLKSRVKELNNESLQTLVTFELLQSVFRTSIKLFIEELLPQLEKFDDLFLSKNIQWYSQNGSYNTMTEVETQWLNEEYLKTHQPELYFSYRLNGFKQGSIETFDSSFQIRIRFDTYWYGFILINYNNQQPFLKKLYHQTLTLDEIKRIIETITSKLIDEIESNVERLNNN